ncbi:MAG: dihydropteroate synthase [Candidatus Nitricoxidivorans perseverans]|uniref:dihydropteroate synthase n=1 Tax=Candidatus Nitricoxidivorans perseverans TaxID=2975601 RepID=A0AA49FKN4_9PROT|nr:MAG: dihydropteroate synthase [Candidatus Nitricoxidivorans perseverans]
MTAIHCGRFRLSLDRPRVMGIVNLTPDSFSGDGVGGDAVRALAHAHAQVDAGADILDLGAESSRPGAAPVSAQQEIDRLLPVVEGLRDCGVPLSVDTAKPEVMRAALAAGADMINDIAALRAPGALEAVAASDAAVCLMHMRGEPGTMQRDPRYDDVVAEVAEFLRGRVAAAEAAGIARNRIVIDPGFGFGKTLAHNLALLRRLDSFIGLGVPVLAGISRKSMLGQITGRSVDERVPASVAAALLAVERGAAIVRVHDTAATRDALAVLDALGRG